jgi:hypothetical protein
MSGNMNNRLFALAAIICAGAPPYCVAHLLLRAQTNAPANQSADAVRSALEPWLRAVEELLNKTKDAEVDSYLHVLHNAAMMGPSGEGGGAVFAQRVLAPPPDTTHAWIGVIVIESRKSLPAGRWQQLASTPDFAAEYHEDTNTIYLRSDLPQIAVIRGLLIMHEMRHWWQAGHAGTPKAPESRLRKEVDAYQTEFRILDALRLPKYQELLTAERLRIRHLLAGPKPAPIEPDVNNPILERAFGRFPNPIAKQMAAAEIAVRAAFGELDTLPATLAQERKIDMLRSLGYQ